MSFSTHTHESAQAAYVAAMAAPLVIAGLPLIESLRTCRAQTDVSSAAAIAEYGRAPLGTLGRSTRTWTHRDRDVVTPANDFLYFCAWMHLRDAPAVLTAPAATGRYFVMELLDAYTDNFINLGTRNVPASGARFTLRGPSLRAARGSADAPAAIAATGATEAAAATSTASAGTFSVDCPTDLVWLIGRVLVADDADLPAARAFLEGFHLDTLAGSHSAAALPASVRLWHDSGDAALDFWANLVNGVAEFPPPDYAAAPTAGALEPGIPATASGPDFNALLRAIGLTPGDTDSLARARPRVLDGLRSAYASAIQIVEAHTVSQAKKSWGYSTQLGRWRGNLLLRATTALKGLGALSADETIYAMADFDGNGEALDGSRAYVLRFAPGALPPADAFWSVSLYGADRFFIDNPIGRYAIGDRTPGLVFDADGSLAIFVQHQRPAAGVAGAASVTGAAGAAGLAGAAAPQDSAAAPSAAHAANWLPAPAGGFYLILRVYHPRAEFLAGKYVIPPLQRVLP